MRKLTAILAALVMPLAASAQYTVGDYTGSNVAMHFADMPRDVAALGMGGATALGSNPASNAFSNPAATPFMDGISAVSLSYGLTSPDLETSTHSVAVGFAYSFKSKLGLNFSFGIDPYRNSTTSVDDNGARADAAQPSSMMVGAGISYRPIQYISFGADVRYMNQGLLGETLGAVSSDIFLQGRFAGVSAALGVRNLGTVFESDNDLPTAGVLALGYSAEFGKHGISVTAEGDGYFYGAAAVCGGLGYTYNRMVTARLGGHYGPDSPLGNYLTAGLGFAISVVGIDFAYVFGEDPFADSFRVGLKFKF